MRKLTVSPFGSAVVRGIMLSRGYCHALCNTRRSACNAGLATPVALAETCPVVGKSDRETAMQAWYHCENVYPFVPKQILDEAESVRASLPNRHCDPKIAADLFEECLDEHLLCDDL